MRTFHTTGPCLGGQHFTVDWSNRLNRPVAALKRGESLFIARGRQTGKTTFLRALGHAARRENLAVALCSLQVAEDQTLLGLLRHIEATVHAAYPVPALPKWNPTEPQSLAFCFYLGDVQKRLGKPLVLFLDEYDSPPRKLTCALLRTFRSALSLQDETRPFIHAIVLCGKTHVRDLRDDLRPSSDETRGSGSLWNIALPVNLTNFSETEMASLIREYSQHSGVQFAKKCCSELWDKTRGQPWLLCRILSQIDEQVGYPRPESQSEGPSVSVQDVRSIVNQILNEDCVHLLSVSDAIRDRKEAQEFLQNLLTVGSTDIDKSDETQSYLLDMGIVSISDSGQQVEISNPIYESYLLKTL